MPSVWPRGTQVWYGRRSAGTVRFMSGLRPTPLPHVPYTSCLEKSSTRTVRFMSGTTIATGSTTEGKELVSCASCREQRQQRPE
eukprot:2468414-Rhodomonas_salina.1